MVVNKIRRAQDGDVLIESANGSGKFDTLRNTEAEVFAKNVTVRHKQHSTIEVLDMDGTINLLAPQKDKSTGSKKNLWRNAKSNLLSASDCSRYYS